MSLSDIVWLPGQAIMHTTGLICRSTRELLASRLFAETVKRFLSRLQRRQSPLLEGLRLTGQDDEEQELLISLLGALGAFPLRQASLSVPGSEKFIEKPALLLELVEELYNYWRGFDRFIVCYSETPGSLGPEVRPYRTFNDTIEQLTHIIRAAYRDVVENISGDHPRIYRQVSAGADAGMIAVTRDWPCPKEYDGLRDMKFIRHVMINPPLIIDPPMNTRTGQFVRVDRNPLQGVDLSGAEWLCYPARVGHLVVFIAFHQRFIGLGCALANLFELADDEQIRQGPDAIYAYGLDPALLQDFGELPTVFYEDDANGLLTAAVPGEDRFGYFGYIKKMVLTLHNIAVMKKLQRLPYHGAMVRLVLKDGITANVIIIGDTAAGKSETLEALRIMADENIRDLRIIADDMGSLEVSSSGPLLGYGTEIGAFVRLDDLQPGYAFDQIDRAVIMSPQKVNARVVIPVTTMDQVLHGYPVDFLLYANNYEEVDEEHPVVERLYSLEKALGVFREGTAMSRGTTTSTGLVHSYFANIFGPAQYREVHEDLAAATFEAAFAAGVYVGQLRTRLGISGYEQKGPEQAARELFRVISQNGRKGDAVVETS